MKDRDLVTIFGSTRLYINNDVGVSIMESSVRPNIFLYKSPNAGFNSAASAKIRVLDPYVLTEENISDKLQTFVHLSISNSSNAKLEITRDNQNYVAVADSESLIGDTYRSISLKVADSFNARFTSPTTVFSATLVQQGST